MTEETNVYDPTVSKFYEAIDASLDNENVVHGAIIDLFEAIWTGVPSPSDIDYVLRDLAEALDAVAATWDDISSQEEDR